MPNLYVTKLALPVLMAGKTAHRRGQRQNALGTGIQARLTNALDLLVAQRDRGVYSRCLARRDKTRQKRYRTKKE